MCGTNEVRSSDKVVHRGVDDEQRWHRPLGGVDRRERHVSLAEVEAPDQGSLLEVPKRAEHEAPRGGKENDEEEAIEAPQARSLV